MHDEVLLNSESEAVKHLIKNDSTIARVINLVGPIEYRPYDDSYSFLVANIIAQMLSNKAGDIITNRLVELCNGQITVKTINNLTNDQIRNTGISNAKVSYIRNLTQAVVSGELDFSALEEKNDSDIIQSLTRIKGIGPWTAKMYLIFVLDRKNVLPFEDGAFCAAYKWAYSTQDVSQKSIKKNTESWNPYCSIASRFLYRALDNGITKKEGLL